VLGPDDGALAGGGGGGLHDREHDHAS
jgi:hypothetical protein